MADAIKGTECKITFAGSVLGYADSVSISIDTGASKKHEIGDRVPKVIKAGLMDVTGSLSRAYVDTTLLQRASGTGDLPTFDIIASGPNGQIKVSGCMVTSWSLDLPLDDWVMDSIDFTAKQVVTV
jgi:hypothetical protein